jgi:hypothetical protein
VRETQGSYAPEDLSRFETATPFLRTFSLFYSFFNAKANLLGRSSTRRSAISGLRKGAGRLLYVYTFGFMMPAVFGHAIKQLATGEQFQTTTKGRSTPCSGSSSEARRDGDAHGSDRGAGRVDRARRLHEEDVGRRHHGLAGGQDDRVSGARAGRRLQGDPRSRHHAPRDHDVLTLLGLLTNLPLAPLARPIGYLQDVNTGKAQAAEHRRSNPRNGDRQRKQESALKHGHEIHRALAETRGLFV